MEIFDASQRYIQEGRPLIILAGKEYGSGSSRDWAAKGPWLLVRQSLCHYVNCILLLFQIWYYVNHYATTANHCVNMSTIVSFVFCYCFRYDIMSTIMSLCQSSCQYVNHCVNMPIIVSICQSLCHSVNHCATLSIVIYLFNHYVIMSLVFTVVSIIVSLCQSSFHSANHFVVMSIIMSLYQSLCH